MYGFFMILKNEWPCKVQNILRIRFWLWFVDLTDLLFIQQFSEVFPFAESEILYSMVLDLLLLKN